MAQDNKIRLPSGQGGLTRYFDEYSSKIEIPPVAVIIMAVIIMLGILLLHQYGGSIFN
ncbi:preprotein translocase subunit Sec61beta [Candidatus Woesearchaeota archaeon]|nr:preprotein translocase subunit Sec61beta [Candidatus Woesearchaeota archaeon]